MKKIKIKVLFIVFILASFSSHGQDTEFDKKAGAEAAIQVEQMIGIYNDSLLTDYVSRVGNRLYSALSYTPFEFKFQIADMAEPNAFALPGGYIYVSRGILSLLNDEAELAGIIGHEMIHVTERHSVKQMKKGIFPSILKIPGAIVGGLVNEDLGRIINSPIDLGSKLFLSSYSRKQEKQSDELGVKLASKAGYDPSKLAMILSRLSAEIERMSGEEEKKSYFSSHPYTPKRLENIEKEVPTLTWNPEPEIIPEKEDLFKKMEGLTLGQNPEQGILKEQVFLHPILNLSLTFPEKWESINVPIAVASMHPEGKGQMMLTIDEENNDADTAALNFKRLIKEKYNVSPSREESNKITGNNSCMLVYTDKSSGQSVDMTFWWVKHEGYLFQILAATYSSDFAAIENSVSSIRTLSEQEKNDITITTLSSEEIKPGESFDTFSKRTSNSWDEETTLLQNGITKDEFERAKVLKIAVTNKYF